MVTILAEKQHVIKMIPQAHPFVMIDKLISTNEVITETGFLVENSNVLCSNGNFSASGLVENIAQTAAVRAGYLAMQNNAKPNIGFIGAIKKLKIHRLPEIGEELLTRIELKSKVLSFSLITGHVYCNDELMAECEMRIFEKAD